MKAAVCHAFGQPLVVEEVTLEPPGPGEISVRIAACAICHSDIHAMEGAWGGALPAVYGHEAAGVVDQIGDDVTRFRPGERVIVTLIRSCGDCLFCARGDSVLCDGTFSLDTRSPIRAGSGRTICQGLRTAAFAERVVVDASQAFGIPDEMPFDAASLLACGVITGIGAVTNTARVEPGSSVAVIGAGGVGLNSIQGARLSGAGPIIAVDLAPAKLKAAQEFGATDTVDPNRDDVREAVCGLTGGRGADYVFITVGAKAAIEGGFGLLSRGGALVIVGMPATGVVAGFDPTTFADHGQRMLGSKMGGTNLQTDVPKLIALYQQGRLKLDELITARYPLEGINEAIAAVKDGRALRNVVVF